MSEEFNVYDHKQQLPHGVWVFNKGSKEWSDEMNANMEALDDVLVRKTLTIKDSEGATLVEFNNTEDKELTLPEATTEVDIKKLTIKDSEGATLVEFDGSTDKELTLPEVEIPEIPEVDIKTLVVKDSAGTTLVEYNGSTDKVLTLPEAQVPQTQGGSFTYNTTKDYTTLYFTEEALQTLGYSGLSDSNALKYRTVIGSQTLKTNASSRPSSPKDSFGVLVNDDYRIVSPNPNLRPNVGAVKSVNYLGSVFSYIINMIDNLAGVDAPHGLTGGEYLVCSIGRVDANNNVKNRIVASVDNSKLMDDPYYQEYRNSTVAELVKFELNGLNDLYSLDEEFKEGDKLVISIYKYVGAPGIPGEYSDSDAGISLDTFNNKHTFSDGSATSIVLGDLCTYEELQDSITPISAQVVPVQVPATKIVYHEDTDATDFNVYTYLLYAYAKDGLNIIHGQNIGNGIVICTKGGSLSYLSVIEGAEECGSTTFNEIYPA